ncbi:OPT-domain-containing protein [Aureobasidium sp. EXF-3400]|nr:OPT-domain-containing protein [Aureobasidium sp. EXF-12344]KAI4772106.1 OPT-domain-containing protein [Aureobasidium sp. EXF-3400]
MASDEDDITPSGDSPSRLKTMNSSTAEQKDSKESSNFRDPASGMDEKDIIGDTEVIQIKDVDDSTALEIENDVEAVMDKVITLSIEECRKLLEQLLEDHKYDYNFTRSQKKKLRNLLGEPAKDQSVGEWEIILKKETAINIFYSPYPEVRSIARPHDDLNVACETIRAHLLGYLWACIGQFVNSLFNARYPTITIASSVTQIFLYPCGIFMAWVLPDWGITIFGKRHSLNPGPWTYKEQMLSTIIVNVGLTSAYVFWNIQTQQVYYKDTWVNLMGLGFAGVLRRFVVYPSQAIWPSILPTVALNRALLVKEKHEKLSGWQMSRYKFFFIFFAAMTAYFWLPGYLFPALSYFAWMTWIKPNDFNLAAVTGSQFGLGFNPLSSLDYNVFSAYAYPLTWPFFSQFQQYMGRIISGLIILATYYSNFKWTGYLPINSSGIFDNTGQPYNITRVMTNGRLDYDEYYKYSPAFYSAGNLVLYSAFFAFYTLTFVFIILDFWRPLAEAYKRMGAAGWSQIKNMSSRSRQAMASFASGNIRQGFHHLVHLMDGEGSVYDGFHDPFTQMMRNYKEVPDWWFLIIALISFIFAIIILKTYDGLQTPVWTIFFVIILNLVFLVPMSYLYAISGTTQGLNIITELVMGYALPGRPEALMFVKAFGYNINGQADNYISDQKMGFYAQIPPRAMYRGQLISAVLTALVAYGCVDFVDNDIKGICTPDQSAKFNCEAGSQIYFSSSVVWGAIGPARVFSQFYPFMKYMFLLGAILAVVWWSIKRYGPYVQSAAQAKLAPSIFRPLNLLVFTPLSWLRDVHPSLVINGFLLWAPYNLTYFTSAVYMSFGFMYYLRRYKTAWWEKYNYVLSAALSAGVAFSGIIIFFAVQYHPVNVNWWGTNIVGEGVDGGAGQTALLTTLPSKGYFGPDTWQ